MRPTLLLSFAIVAACGGKFSTSIDGSKPTNQLAPSDADQLCHDEYNYILSSFSEDDVAKLTCSGAATQSGGDCQSAFDTCVAQAKSSMTWPPPQGPDCTAFAQSLAQCNTTVGQYTDCIQQEMNMVKSLESQAPFCTQGAEEQAVLQAEGQISPTCLTLMQKCPLEFGGSTVSGGSDGGLPDGG